MVATTGVQFVYMPSEYDEMVAGADLSSEILVSSSLAPEPDRSTRTHTVDHRMLSGGNQNVCEERTDLDERQSRVFDSELPFVTSWKCAVVKEHENCD